MQHHFFKWSPLLLIIWGIIYSVFLPIIPVAGGFGWDGVLYGQMAMDFENMFGDIKTYNASRIFPSVLIYYAFKVAGIAAGTTEVLTAFMVYNIMVLGLSAFLWVRIALHLSLGYWAKWLGFCALFVSFPLLNFIFYYPANTDSTAFLLGMIIWWAYLKNNNYVLLAAGVLAFFSWPALLPLVCIIFIFRHSGNMRDFTLDKPHPFWLFVLLLAPFLAFLSLHFAAELHHLAALLNVSNAVTAKMAEKSTQGFHLFSFFNALTKAAFLVFVFWFLLRNFDILKFVKSLAKRRLIGKLLILAAVFVPFHYLKTIYSAPEGSSSGLLGFMVLIVTGENVRMPLQFTFMHISYWGPAVILMFLFAKNMSRFLAQSSVALNMIFLLTILFGIHSQSRFLSGFYPFLVYILLMAVDWEQTWARKKATALLFVVVSLLYARIWHIYELPATPFPVMGDKVHLFPMQWFFMNNGSFANTQMLILNAILAAVFVGVFYKLLYVKGMRSVISQKKSPS